MKAAVSGLKAPPTNDISASMDIKNIMHGRGRGRGQRAKRQAQGCALLFGCQALAAAACASNQSHSARTAGALRAPLWLIKK